MSKSDKRTLTKTKTPGIYKRGNSYVVVYRAGGKQRKQYARTLAQARKLKAAQTTDDDRGEYQEPTTITLRAFLSTWIDTYYGDGKRGFRENTRDEYRRLLDQYAHRYFGERLRLTEVTPKHLSGFVAWLMDPSKQDGRVLADATIRNAVMPLRAALATAKRDHTLRYNPAVGLALPKRARVEEEEDEEVRVLSREQLRALLDLTPAKHKMLVTFVASTGVRVSEAIGLQRKHLRLDGSEPEARIRRAIVKGRIGPPKSSYGKRAISLPASLVFELRAHLAAQDDQSPDALVFPSQSGTPLDPDNMRRRVLKPIAGEIEAGWMGWHTLRHTFASLQISAGANLLQLSRALGHHAPSFTLDVYSHLLDKEQCPPLDLANELVRPVSHSGPVHAERAA